MKTLVHQKLGDSRTPQDVKDLRKNSFDLHQELGFAVVHKHRWTDLDVRSGKARLCPFHDDLYQTSASHCQYCFGTGYVGGWDDGTIVYVTLQDATTDTINILPSGILQMQHTPQVTAPWLPLFGDGDMIILADFAPGSWEIVDVHDRYVLQQVRPITIRGPGWGRQSSAPGSRFRISQESNADRLPYNHEFYDVPITFDYDSVPADTIPPGEGKPLDEGVYRAIHTVFTLAGTENKAKRTQLSTTFVVTVDGETDNSITNISTKGKGAGTIIQF